LGEMACRYVQVSKGFLSMMPMKYYGTEVGILVYGYIVQNYEVFLSIMPIDYY